MLTLMLFFTTLVIYFFSWVAVDHKALAKQGISFSSYVIDTRFGNMPLWASIFLPFCVIIPIFGIILFFAPNPFLTPRRTLFKHEIKLGLVPFVNGHPVAFPRKKELEDMEWKKIS